MGQSTSKAEDNHVKKSKPKRSRSVPARLRSRNSAKSQQNNINNLNDNNNNNNNIHDLEDPNDNPKVTRQNSTLALSNGNSFAHHDTVEVDEPVKKGSKLKRGRSTNSLNRLKNSFRFKNRSLLSLNCISRRGSFNKKDDIITPKVNVFAKLYKENLHLLVFQHFDFNERLKLREVCSKWSKDLFINCKEFRYPSFPEMIYSKYYQALDKNDRIMKNSLAIVSSNKLAHQCSPSMEVVEFTGAFSKNILSKFYQHCFATNINTMKFQFDDIKFEIFSPKFWKHFYIKFGSKLECISIEPQSKAKQINSDITDLIIMGIDSSHKCCPLLKGLSLKISNRVTAVQFFQDNRLEGQIEHLTIEFFYEYYAFKEDLLRCLQLTPKFINLKTLKIKLVPYLGDGWDDLDESDAEHDYDFSDIFDEIFQTTEKLSSTLQDLPVVLLDDEHLPSKVDRVSVMTQWRQSFGDNLQLFFGKCSISDNSHNQQVQQQ